MSYTFQVVRWFPRRSSEYQLLDICTMETRSTICTRRHRLIAGSPRSEASRANRPNRHRHGGVPERPTWLRVSSKCSTRCRSTCSICCSLRSWMQILRRLRSSDGRLNNLGSPPKGSETRGPSPKKGAPHDENQSSGRLKVSSKVKEKKESTWST